MKSKKVSIPSDIDEKNPLVKKFVECLAKMTKQAIPIVEVEKVKRIQGVTTRPIHIGLEKGQTVKLFLRVVDNHADVLSIKINGKNQLLTGDFSLDYMPAFKWSVYTIAGVINKGQAQFEKKRDKQASKAPKTTTSNRNPPKNKVQQLQALREQVQNLDEVIAGKQQVKSQLETELAELTA